MEVVEDLLDKGKQLMVQVDMLPKMEEMLKGAVLWKEKASRIFLRKGSPFTLMEVITKTSLFTSETIFILWCYGFKQF